jgi:hypothetical protein
MASPTVPLFSDKGFIAQRELPPGRDSSFRTHRDQDHGTYQDETLLKADK